MLNTMVIFIFFADKVQAVFMGFSIFAHAHFAMGLGVGPPSLYHVLVISNVLIGHYPIFSIHCRADKGWGVSGEGHES